MVHRASAGEAGVRAGYLTNYQHKLSAIMNRVLLRETLFNGFSLDELQTLCFDLSIDFDGLTGNNKQAKAREIILYCEKIGRVPELVEAIRRFRPNLDLPDPSKIEPSLEQRNADELVPYPAVARPVNLSFEVLTVDDKPSGWFNSRGFVTGVSANYRIRVVPREQGSGMCVLFQNYSATKDEFGSLMQRFPAYGLANKTIRIEADIKTDNVDQWSGMWIRADGDTTPDLLFDNMSRRPIRGTTAWKRYTIDAHLPKETAWLNYGIVLAGPGAIWADNFRLLIWTNRGSWADV